MVRAIILVIGFGLGLGLGLPSLAVRLAQAAEEINAIQPAATELAAYIDIVGAPGDGKQALETALSNRLMDEGFTVTGRPEIDAYEIQGWVRLSPADRGKENIRIDWTIFGPGGMRIGNVTQTNVIRKGSLNRHWGAAASAAAAAAAQDILKLLPR